MDGKNKMPDVRSYLDAIQFLQDIYTYFKTANPKFSYDAWAKQMGLQSKSYLRFAVLGQRGISAEITQRISKFLDLKGSEAEYFSLLVLFTQCAQQEQKTLLGRRLTQLLRQSIPVTEISIPASVIASPLAVTVRNILSFEDIPRTEDFISTILNISALKLQETLNLLEAEGLIYQKEGSWIATHDSLRVTEKSNGETKEFHRLSLLKAIESQSLPVDTRNFRSVGIAMNPEEYKNYLDELDQFVKSIFARYDGPSLRERKIYQMNFNAFPWTEKVPASTSK